MCTEIIWNMVQHFTRNIYTVFVSLCFVQSFLPEASFGLCVRQPRACLYDNSSPVQPGITKFEPEVQNTLSQNLPQSTQ